MADVVYDPIVDFRSGDVMGWEVLVQGARHPTIRRNRAGKTGKGPAWNGDLWRQAINGFGPVSSGRLLFIPFSALSLCAADFDPETLMDSVCDAHITPGNLVMAVSDLRSLLDSHAISNRLERCRKIGFSVAVDDVGDRLPGLRWVTELRPTFIRIDPDMVRGIDGNPNRKILIDMLLAMGAKIGYQVIATGVETQAEMASLATSGVRYGQGSCLASPAASSHLSSRIKIPFIGCMNEGDGQGLTCRAPVSAFIQQTLQVHPQTTVSEVRRMLADKPPMTSVAVVDHHRPVGLLMNYELDRRLGTPYGLSLYYRRSISRIMDSRPLTVDKNEPVEKVAKAAMSREGAKVYDDIIVTDNGAFLGTISVQKMLDTLARIQVEMAKGANPLTGLPGNVAIEREIDRRAEEKRPCSLLYIDLDNFKIYNDAYGFEKGDAMILMTAGILKASLEAHGTAGDFVGHVGGDDFVIISDAEKPEKIADAMIALFKEDVLKLYSSEDRTNGFIIGKGRDGIEKAFPLASVSIGIMTCEFTTPFTRDELSHRIAEIKKYAKLIPGNAWVKDRRTPIGGNGIPPTASVKPPSDCELNDNGANGHSADHETRV